MIASGFYAPEIQKERIKKCVCGQLGIRHRSGRPWIWTYCRGVVSFESIQVAPIGPRADFHHERHGQFVDAFHFFLNQFFQF